MIALTVGVAASTKGLTHADAHDPGQGDEIADVTLVAEVTNRVVTVGAGLGADAGPDEPIRVVARRGGRTLTGSLGSTPTGWVGQVDVDQDGRCFVYVEGRLGQQHLEAWIPVIAGSTGTGSKDTVFYVGDGDGNGGVATSQVIASVLLLSLVAALVAPSGTVVRSTLSARDVVAGVS